MRKRFLSLIIIPFLLLSGGTASAEEKEENWQDETMYFLMTDRFMNGDRSNDQQTNNNDPSAYQGGDFKGIQNKLDYVKELGSTSIVISPVFENEAGAYHGYHITDYTKLNPQFGTEQQLKALVDSAHKKGIRVLVDFPATRVSTEHVWLKEADKADWFTNVSVPQKPGWLGNMALLNTENSEVQSALVKAAVNLAERTGIDGYFFSSASAAKPDFWSAFHEAMPEMHLIGEMTEVPLQTAAVYEQAGLDAVTSSWIQEPLRNQFATVDRPSDAVQKWLLEEKRELKHPLETVHLTDSALTDRFTLDMANENMFPGARWRMALTYLYTAPGTPAVFYGSEIAQNGESGPDAHGLMNFRTDQELVDYIKQIAALRQELPALRRGSYESIYEQNGLSVFKRQYKDETIVVAINNTGETQSIAIPASKLDEDKELRGLLAGDMSRAADGEFTIILDREEAEIYALAEKTGVNYAFIAAMAAVWVVFVLFLYVVWKRGKRAAQS
ncbi:alpha-amylase family glycosyl hydrolase [Domibacillus robiginosus]|uniref:alpha-amylase family glycosyl hydrolase n=1 Tax=Domibacillus robiginosus TaxID=1071054 RepID=UPI00067E2904|nr:alpha-amylase family glycosyl hydrolase [Domibacillus robiginosus]